MSGGLSSSAFRCFNASSVFSVEGRRDTVRNRTEISIFQTKTNLVRDRNMGCVTTCARGGDADFFFPKKSLRAPRRASRSTDCAVPPWRPSSLRRPGDGCRHRPTRRRHARHRLVCMVEGEERKRSPFATATLQTSLKSDTKHCSRETTYRLLSSAHILATTSQVRSAVRVASWSIASCAATIAWWVIASQILHSKSIFFYFVLPTCTDLILGWLLGIWSMRTSRAKTAAVAIVSILISLLVFVAAVIVAAL
jgi:hypothetical protein